MSKGPAVHYTGDEWQSHFLDLLNFVHGTNEFARVPDEYMGDFGIEAFSFVGDAYQCFADQGSNNKKERYEKQRDKLTEDLNKISTNAADILRLTHGRKIRRYIFVVPLNDNKNLTSHAAAKTQELLDKNLPHLTVDFEIVVKDQRALDVYERMLNKAGGAKVKLPDDSPDDLDIVEVKAAVADEQLELLLGKLSRAYPGDGPRQLEERIDNLLKVNAFGQNRLREIGDASQQIYQNITSEIAARERRLTTIGPVNRPTPILVLQEELSELTNDIRHQVTDIDAETIQSISLSAVTMWMLRCPLDF